jgi:hypothetical protein
MSRHSLAREVPAALLFGIVGWATCAGVLSIALHLASRTLTALAVHMVVVPIVFGFVSLVYFRRPRPLPPFVAAAIFALVAFGASLLLEALFRRTFDVANEILATWLPAHLALLATWISGLAMSDHTEHAAPHSLPPPAPDVA